VHHYGQPAGRPQTVVQVVSRAVGASAGTPSNSTMVVMTSLSGG
jgi:hypothetical protein